MTETTLPPFMNSTGLIAKIFSKIQEAQEPPRYTQNFQESVLGYGSGSAKPFIPFLKRLGFLESDGRPTEIYRRFRNADTAGGAMAEAIRKGYKTLYQRNEYAHELSADKLKSLIVEVTGKEKNAKVIRAIVSSYTACKSLADFEAQGTATVGSEVAPDFDVLGDQPAPITPQNLPSALNSQAVGMSFGYTINLNLPETDDPKVFNAIFSALKETLLKE